MSQAGYDWGNGYLAAMMGAMQEQRPRATIVLRQAECHMPTTDVEAHTGGPEWTDGRVAINLRSPPDNHYICEGRKGKGDKG